MASRNTGSARKDKRVRRRTTGTKPVSKGGRIAFIALVVVVVVAVAIFLLMRGQGQVSVAENAVGSLIAPVESGINTVVDWVRDSITAIRDYNQLRYDYNAAQEELANAKLEIARLEEVSQENERLRTLLDADERYQNLNPLYASVIAKQPGVWFDSFTIDKGSLNGVEANMAVVTADGLVGRIYEVGLNYSKVLSIIDSRSSVACVVERTRDNGVMRGKIESGSVDDACNMYYLPANHDVIPGDTVLTSGVDNLYPKGLPVGTVREVSRQTDSTEQYIVISPLADFLHLEEVLVLRTVVESDSEALPSLPTATPRPTATATATPEPTALNSGNTPEPTDNGNYVLPTVAPQDIWQAEPGVESSPTPTPEPSAGASASPAPDAAEEAVLPEDRWALEE